VKNYSDDPLPAEERDRLSNLPPNSTELALADIIEYGEFNETGGTLGRADWPTD